MGNGVSQKKSQDLTSYGWTHVQLDKQAYHPGDLVSGKVYLEILKPCNRSQLLLKLDGKEAAYVVQTSASALGTVQDNLSSSSRSIVKQQTVLHAWESLSIGQYEVPFSFALPTNIPASFHIETSSFAGYIRYNLEVSLQIDQPSRLNLESKQKIIIREPMKTSPQNFSKESLMKLKSSYFVPKGQSTLRIFIGKVQHDPNGTVEAVIEFDNSQSRVENLEITLSLISRLRIGNLYHPTQPEITYVTSCLAGVPAKCPKKSNCLTFRLPGLIGDDHDLELRTDHWPQNKYSSGLPSITKGKLIKSEIFLQIRCKMAGHEKNSQEILCPIQLNQPEPQPKPFAVPNGWNPDRLERMNFEDRLPKNNKSNKKTSNKTKSEIPNKEGDITGRQNSELRRLSMESQI